MAMNIDIKNTTTGNEQNVHFKIGSYKHVYIVISEKKLLPNIFQIIISGML